MERRGRAASDEEKRKDERSLREPGQQDGVCEIGGGEGFEEEESVGMRVAGERRGATCRAARSLSFGRLQTTGSRGSRSPP